MEIEIQGIPQSVRPSYQGRIKACKTDLSRYKKLSKDVHTQLSRSELFTRRGIGGPTSGEPHGSTSDRMRLLAGTALLEDGSWRLLGSKRIALETEEQGADILRGLRGQREQIQNARDTVRAPLPCCPSALHLLSSRAPTRPLYLPLWLTCSWPTFSSCNEPMAPSTARLARSRR